MKWSWMPGMIFLLAVGSADAQVTQQWAARYQGASFSSDVARAIAVDGSGNVHVTGQSQDEGFNTGYATVAYDANGNQRWVGPVPGAKFQWL